ncbi:MAG: DUF2726 domain-containing protein [Pseudomonadota bacterium]
MTRVAKEMLRTMNTLAMIEAVVVVGLAIALAVALRRLRASRAGRRPLRAVQSDLDLVQRTGFGPRPLLSPDEARWLSVITATAEAAGYGFYVMAHVALGRAIRPDSDLPARAARRAGAVIHDHRISFGVFDRAGYIAAGVCYNDALRTGRGQVLRDATCRAALRNAGVPVIEVWPGDDDAEVATRLYTLLMDTKPEEQAAAAVAAAE